MYASSSSGTMSADASAYGFVVSTTATNAYTYDYTDIRTTKYTNTGIPTIIAGPYPTISIVPYSSASASASPILYSSISSLPDPPVIASSAVVSSRLLPSFRRPATSNDDIVSLRTPVIAVLPDPSSPAEAGVTSTPPISDTNITSTLASTQQAQLPAANSAAPVTSTLAGSASPSVLAHGATHPGSHKLVYAIAGGVGGGILILLLAAALLVWRRKRRSAWRRLGPRDSRSSEWISGGASTTDTEKSVIDQELTRMSGEDNETDDPPVSHRGSSDMDSVSSLSRYNSRSSFGHPHPDTSRLPSHRRAPTSDSTTWQSPPSTQSSPPSYSSNPLARRSLSLRRFDTSTSSAFGADSTNSLSTLPPYETSD